MPNWTRSHRAVLDSQLWPRWSQALAIVKPETVVRWHREGFRIIWRWKSRSKGGRPKVTREARELIGRMARENPTWGAPRVTSELLKLGFEIAERTVARYMPKRPAPEGALKNWMAFLRNHREAIAAMDFFAVPTAKVVSLPRVGRLHSRYERRAAA